MKFISGKLGHFPLLMRIKQIEHLQVLGSSNQLMYQRERLQLIPTCGSRGLNSQMQLGLIGLVLFCHLLPSFWGSVSFDLNVSKATVACSLQGCLCMYFIPFISTGRLKIPMNKVSGEE